MNLKNNGDVIYESDLNDFDLRPSTSRDPTIASHIKSADKPVGIVRVSFKGGIPISRYIERIQES
ncbi:hypothetical protein EXT57_01010 [Pectobacterium brasiliense]|uniref:hypothetical protein n=1 Tax=Pectobacterium brasiliense TaxID=180957 RepID=UPI00202D2B8E|nr:hypothetical protein [Pectobacterium brasiliense]MCL6375955.1 hypothetical protein [Pectobacterium brasiliense]